MAPRLSFFLLALAALGFPMFLPAQSDANYFQFIENRGQWDGPHHFFARIPGGNIFLQPDGFMFDIQDIPKRNLLIDKTHHREPLGSDTTFTSHAVLLKFIGSSPDVRIQGTDPFSFYHNYYIGQNQSRWKSEVQIYRHIKYTSLYDGIDVEMTTVNGQLKYDFIIAPGKDVKIIRWQYDGAGQVALEDGKIKINTVLGALYEYIPKAYQLIGGDTIDIACSFTRKGKKFGFTTGAYDPAYPLVIDPALIFSTYSGSNADNFGFTATYDNNGNGYGGGIVFANNAYPGTTGSYQAAYGGGRYDVLIGKFSSNGTNLLYYTYLGGGKGDAPFSLVVDANNNLFVLGITGSLDYPTTTGAFQTSHQGGAATQVIGNPNEFTSGTDLFVAKFNSTGTNLIGSTYVGGSQNDGLNTSTWLRFNYADEFRGEIITDAAGNCYVASTSLSSNFPVVNGAQPTHNGGQDAVVFKMNPTLTTMLWSTYLGGTGNDAAYSLQQKSNGDIYVTGGTTSANFPVTPGVIKPTFGGPADGFITRLSPNGNIMLNSTYVGTGTYDQCYILQMDAAEDIYVVGQTRGAYPIVNGPLGPVYSNPNSGQFIHKLNPTLTSTIFSTVFGRGIPGQIDIVPTAFLVDICNHIYVAGWGGIVNSGLSGGSTSGLPVTNNAYQSTTDGSDFYFIVLNEDATGLRYASFFGGGLSHEHVDGGTSRFDKNGIIYEAVCAGCGGLNDFPTSPGAYSSTNNSSVPVTNCNLGLFKFDVSEFSALIDIQSPTMLCENGVITLQNMSTGGDNYHWDLGDGTIVTTPTVSHTYANPGTYTVMLIVTSNSACVSADTAFLTVTVEPLPNAAIAPVNPLCLGSTVQLVASGGANYQWSPHPSLSAVNIPNPVISPTQTTTYTVTASNNCGSDVATITVPVIEVQATASPDDTICLGSSIQLWASGGATYQWNNIQTLSSSNVSNPTATPTSSTTYIVTVTDTNNCSITDTVHIQVDIFPQADAGPDQTICFGDATTLNATGGTFYQWSPPQGLNNAFIANPQASPAQTTQYVVQASNTCGTDEDTVVVNVIRINASVSPDTIICPGESVMLIASGGVTYKWQPPGGLNSISNDTVIATPPSPTTYSVLITDQYGCQITENVSVGFFPVQYLDLGPNILIEFGGSVQLNAQGTGTFQWTPDSFLTCGTCPDPIAFPPSSMLYSVTLTDSNNCKVSDSIMIFVEGCLYVPNTFTPNKDFLNDIFRAYGVEIRELDMWIFTRWGELIYHTRKIDMGWDGTHKGEECPVGVYVWRIDWTEVSGKQHQLFGHVNLLR